MNILFYTESQLSFMSGMWLHRALMPSLALGKRGHATKTVAIGKEVPEQLMEWPDVVVFGRTYNPEANPVQLMHEYKKRGKRVLYDMDDDHWLVAKDNPSHLVSNAFKDQYEGFLAGCDAIITPSKTLAKKFKCFKKPVFICPNGVDSDLYSHRKEGHGGQLIIGYTGAASHWKDLTLITKVLRELNKKYDFLFTIYGMVSEPLEAAIYSYDKLYHMNLQPEKAEYYKSALDFYRSLEGLKMYHVPFMPPELHPKTLAACDFDIGIAPLEDTEFNRGKSSLKFYEYAAVGTATLTSDVVPYSEECTYRAKNTEKDWYNKLEKLITDEAFRNKLAKEQSEYVWKTRSTDVIGIDWELACQKPTKWGLKVLTQQK